MVKKFFNIKDLNKELNRNHVSDCYLFLGEEEGEKDKCINRIITMILGESDDAKNSVGRFYLDDNEDFLKAVDFTLSQSMFSNKKVAVLRNIDKLSSTNNNTYLFGDLIQNRFDSTTLIITSSENRPPSFFKAPIVEQFTVVQFWRFFDQDIYNYININIKKLNMSIDQKAVEKLIARTGKDIKKIDDAIDIIMYSGETGLITEDIIDKFVHDVKEVSVFDFLDALFILDKKSLTILKKLIEFSTPDLLLLNLIQKQADKFELYYDLIQNGQSQDEAIKKCGVTVRQSKKFILQAQRLNKHIIKDLFSLIGKADIQIKSGGTKKGIINNPLTQLVSDILFKTKNIA